MEDEPSKRRNRPRKDKAVSPLKKDEDEDFKIKNVVIGKSEVRRNPKRQVGVKNYEEIEEPQDDRYVYCDFCEEVFVDNCSKCGQLAILQDVEVEMGVENRAKLTVPKTTLDIQPSPIHGLGVYAKVLLKKGVKMGPYDGKITRMECSTGYSWKLRDGRLVDAADEKFSNWMRFINCARNINEQNLVAFQYKGGLYYRTCRDINAGEELLVYYGQSFADLLGIDTKNYFKPKVENISENAKWCKHCNYGYSDYVKLTNHVALCKWNPENFKKMPDKVFYCRFCPVGMADEEYYMRHEKICERKQKENIIKYKIEGIGTNERKTKRNSMKKDVLYQCQNCNYSTDCKSNLKKHQGIHRKVFSFSCRICVKGFNSGTNLKIHMFHHVNEATKITTLQTTKVFNDNATRSKIQAEISGSKLSIIKYNCEKCEYTTARITSMKYHIKIHTKRTIFSCYSCKYSSGDLKEVQSHVLLFHDGEYNKCEDCRNGKFCGLHISSKVGYEKGHTCNICGSTLTERRSLKGHIKAVHMKERNYKCNLCEYSAKRKLHLKDHNDAIHLHLRHYKCDRCDFSATQKGHLKWHINSKHLK